MWIGTTYYDGQLPLKGPDETWAEFGRHFVHLVCEGAYPTAKAWTTYWAFFVLEALMFVTLPLVSIPWILRHEPAVRCQLLRGSLLATN